MVKKVLITGISGFVGPYLRKELEIHGDEVWGLDRSGDGKKIIACDILDKEKLESALNQVRPDLIFHLAGFSSEKGSWKKPDLCRQINVEGTKNLLEAVKSNDLRPRILVVSSAQVYGKPKELPLKETSPLFPESPYAKSRLEQEKLLEDYKDLDWVVARSFNHTGPGQQPLFVIPEFAKQLAEIKKGLHQPVIEVGNLEIKRDFSDVRDVVRAYRLLLEKGKSHEIYNVCSGKSYKISELLEKMIDIIDKKIEVKIDKNKFRPVDVTELRGDNSKLKKLGFEFKFDINKTINDSINWYVSR